MSDFEEKIKAAESGDPEAQLHLSLSYFLGKGTERDYEKAFEWGVKAANQGHARGYAMLGMLYFKGHGTEKNEHKGVELFLKAAEHGQNIVFEYLGEAYAEGKGAKKDYVKAAIYYALHLLNKNKNQLKNLINELFMAEQYKTICEIIEQLEKIQGNLKTDDAKPDIIKEGFTTAQRFFCQALRYGKDLIKLEDLAQSDTEAMYLAGLCYERGYGTNVFLGKSFYYWNLAAAKGNTLAAKALEKFF